MTKSDILDSISDSTGFEKKDIITVMDSYHKLIINSLKEGNKFKINKIGTLFPKHKPERLGRDPYRGGRALLRAKTIVQFKQSTGLELDIT